MFEKKDTAKSEIPVSTSQYKKSFKPLNETEQVLVNSMKNSSMLLDDDVIVPEIVPETKVEQRQPENSNIEQPKLLETSFDAEVVTHVENHVVESKQEVEVNGKQEIPVSELDIIDTGYKAVALYDYQACKLFLRIFV